MKDSTSSKRALVMTFVTLVYITALKLTTRCIAACRADISSWPAELIQRMTTLVFRAVLFDKIVQAKTFLKLYSVLWHDENPHLFSRFHYASTAGSIAEPSR